MVVSVWIFLHLNASRATLTTGEIGGALMMLACHAVLTRSVCLYVEEFGDIVRLKGRSWSRDLIARAPRQSLFIRNAGTLC